MAQLNASLSTIAYNLTLGQIIDDGSALSGDMNTTLLTESNMAETLALLQARTALVEHALVNLALLAEANSAVASHVVNGDTLTYLTDLSEINLALARSIELFAERIRQLAPLTQTPILSDATAAMLQLAYDIKVMGDRMMAMRSTIVVMADNMGLMSARIVEVQQIMHDNMRMTSASLDASKNIVVGIIGAYAL